MSYEIDSLNSENGVNMIIFCFLLGMEIFIKFEKKNKNKMVIKKRCWKWNYVFFEEI